jgi:hypothetical protein
LGREDTVIGKVRTVLAVVFFTLGAVQLCFGQAKVKRFEAEGKAFTVTTYTLDAPNYGGQKLQKIEFQEILFPDQGVHFYLSALSKSGMYTYTSDVKKIELKDVNFDGVKEVCLSVDQVGKYSLTGSGIDYFRDCVICLKQFGTGVEQVFMYYKVSGGGESGDSVVSTYKADTGSILQHIAYIEPNEKQKNGEDLTFTFDRDGRPAKGAKNIPVTGMAAEKVELVAAVKDGIELLVSPDPANPKTISTLMKSQTLRVVRREPETVTVGGKRGRWCQLITPDNQIGWCFDANFARGKK